MKRGDEGADKGNVRNTKGGCKEEGCKGKGGKWKNGKRKGVKRTRGKEEG
jgi:hypothetical protein